MSQPLRVHGLAGDSVAPDWPALNSDDVLQVLGHFPQLGALQHLNWHSPRPFSSAGLATTDHGEWFIKRHPRRVREAAWLEEEHAFIAHLRQAGLGVPAVQASRAGHTAVALGDWCYEVHARAPGHDLYREAQSWSPFQALAHAHAAGRSLGLLHGAAEGFTAPLRQAQVLTSRWQLFNSGNPASALAHAQRAHPALAAYLRTRDWQAELGRHVLPAVQALRPWLAEQAPLWTHNDWHASNLLWGASGEVQSVLDFGLCDRTFALYDLATALERNTVPWLQLGGTGTVEADLAAVDALLTGYAEVRPLPPRALAALAALLPVVHAEFAWSEMVYFAEVLGNRDSTALAWEGYLLGHAAWFAGSAGQRLLASIHQWHAPQAPTAAPAPTRPAPPLLVSAQWLGERLHATNLVILDATVVLPAPRFDGDYRASSGHPGWLEAHIPGARHADLTHDLHQASAGYSFAMPGLDLFAAQLQRLGIDDRSQVVLYDRTDGFWAARLWWMLRSVGVAASVLDGGLGAWHAAAYPTHSGPAPAPPSHTPPTLHPQPGHWAAPQQVLAVSQGQAPGVLVCALGQGVFEGSAATRYHRRGHIPGSLNRPARQLFDAHGRYRPPAQLREALGPALLDAPGPLVLYCGGGISAAATAFALALLGRTDVAVYDGSLQQWSADPALPMATGAAPA